MGVQVINRESAGLLKALRGAPHAYRRNLLLSFARSDQLATSIAQALRNSQKVVLLDVDYNSPLFGENKSIKECVRAELGSKAHLTSEVINLDHHSKELGDKTATELVFENLFNLRNLPKTIVATINHGDTDAAISAFVANNIDRDFSPQEKSLLIAAARAGDHSEGDFLAPKDKLTPAVRLNLALDQLFYENGITLRQVWRANEEQIKTGMQKAIQLIEGSLRDVRALYTSEVDRLIEANSVRLSYRIVEDASQGKEVAGVTIDRTIEGCSIVTVDVATPGLDNFNPIPAYRASSKPAIILIVRNGRVVGVGRNEEYNEWLNLLGSDRVEGFYSRFGLRLKGGAHAGGANVARDAFDTLPTPAEALSITQEFLRESLAQRA